MCSIFTRTFFAGFLLVISAYGRGLGNEIKQLDVDDSRDRRLTRYETRSLYDIGSIAANRPVGHPLHVVREKFDGVPGDSGIYVYVYNPPAYSDNPSIFSYKDVTTNQTIDDDPIKMVIGDVSVYTEPGTGQRWLVAGGFRNDSAFVVKTLPGTEKFDVRYLCSGKDQSGNGVWEPQVGIVAANDYDYDGHTEVFVNVHPDRDLSPRILFCVQMDSLKIDWELPVAASVLGGQLYSCGDSLNPAVIFAAYNAKQGGIDSNFSDLYAYIAKVDASGKIAFNYIGSVEHGTVNLIAGPDDSTFFVTCSQPLLPSTDTTAFAPSDYKLYRISRDGVKLDSTETGTIVRSLFYSDYDGDRSIELFTIDALGVLTTYDFRLRKIAESKRTTLVGYLGEIVLPDEERPCLVFGTVGGRQEIYSADFTKRAIMPAPCSYWEPLKYDQGRRPTVYVAARAGGGMLLEFRQRHPLAFIGVIFNDYQLYILLTLFALLLGLLAVNHYRLKKSRALAESELRLGALLEETPMGVALFQDGDLQYVNKRLSEILGYTTEELLVPGFGLQIVHPDDRILIHRDFDDLLSARRTNSQYVARYYTKSGQLLHMQVNNTRITSAGRPAVIGTFLDVTENLGARAELERETHTLNNIIELNPYPIGIFDKTGHFVRANGAFYSLFRSAPDRNYNFFEDPVSRRLGHEDYVRESLLAGKQCFVPNFSYNAREVGPQYPDNPVTVNIVIFPITDVDNQPEYYVFIYEDVTGKNRAEQALRESEERFRALAECSLVGIYILQDGKFTYANPKLAELLDLSVEEVLAIESPLEYICVDDQPKVREFIRQRLVGETEFVHYEFRIVVPEKLDKYVEVFGSSMTFQGKPAVIGTMLDVTERKRADAALLESESKYRTLLANIPIGVFRSIPGGKGFYSVNPAMARMYGYTDSEMLTKTSAELYCDSQDGRALKKLLETSDSVTDIESRMRRKDGSTFYISTSIRAIRDDSGKLLYYDGIDIDITNQKLAEQSLRESEAKYRAVLEQSSDSIYLMDPDTMAILEANAAMQLLLGYSDDEFKTLTADQIAAEGTEMVESKVRAARISGSVFMANRKYRRKDGSLVDVEVSANMITYGGRYVLSVVSRDVTERKLAERMLRQREEMLAAQYNAIPVPTYTWQKAGDDFVLIDFNHKAREITDGHIERYRGTTLSNLYAGDPDMRENIHQTFKQKTSKHWEMLYRFQSTDKKRYLSVNLSYVPDDIVLVHTTDITDRKLAEAALTESEAKFRSLAESTSAAILIFQDDRMVYANPMAVTITGYTRDEILTFSFWDIIHPEARAMVKERGLARQRGERVEKSYEVPLLTKDGRKKWMLYTGDIIEYNGRPAVLGTAFDITDRKTAEAELLVANQERYNQVKEIAGGIAHEIYNALFPATSMLDKLRQRMEHPDGADDPGRNLKHIGMAEASLDRAIKMTETVTQFSRIESQRQTEEIDLTTFFEELIQSTPRLHNSISFRLDIRVGLSVTMNREHAFSLFNNILNNALDELEERGRGHIDIVVSRSGVFAAVDIIDDGPGIPEEVLRKIFLPFFSTKPRTGTGLGLAICKKVADLYGGKITVESTIDKGTRFSILLPTS